MRPLASQLTFLFVAAVAVPVVAQTLPVYDTFGPKDTYDYNNAALMQGPDSPYGLFSSGFEFTPLATVRLDSVQLPVNWLSGSGRFTLSLQRADRAQGMPGTLLETFSGVSAGGAILTLDSVARPVLETGLSYWLVGVGEGNSVLSWPCSSLGLRGNYYSVQGGTEMLGPDQRISAFRVSGTEVPEPSVAAFFLLGAVSFALASSKRTARLPGPSTPRRRRNPAELGG